MTQQTTPYRWNTLEAAEIFDRAAEYIHPLYRSVQDEVLGQLPFADDAAICVVDLGGGSGRLLERILDRFPRSSAVLIDQSEPFLALAERRLRRFGNRAALFRRRLQDDWPADLTREAHAFVSMSAIHHLDAAEKQRLFARCHGTLSPGGVFINGDEVRAESDSQYLANLHWWCEEKAAADARGQIPAAFQPVFAAWQDRNIRRFGEPKHSGDDCHETIDTQFGYLRNAGFEDVECTWSEKMWAVMKGRKTRR